jgi:hypothetical protein
MRSFKSLRRIAAFIISMTMIATAPLPALAQDRPGIGKNEGTPLGEPFVLPAGIQLAGPIVGAKQTSEGGKLVSKCPDGTEFSEPTTFVQACVPVCGAGSVDFPPGLIIVTASEGFQNGLLVERRLVTVPPTQCDALDTSQDPYEDEEKAQKVHWITLSAYCVNEDLSFSSPEASYSFGPVTSDPGLVKVLELVGNRRAATEDDMSAIQGAIFSVTDRNEPIKSEDAAHIRKLPRT